MTEPPHDTHGHAKKAGKVRYFKLGEGYDLVRMSQELDEYTDILFGRVDPPIDVGVMTMAEIASAFYCRAREMEMELLELEAEGAVIKGSRPYKFRTGKLRAFIDMAKNCYELGSRRVSAAQLESEERRYG